MDLAPSPEVAELARRTAAFVRAVVVPVEERHGGVVPSDDVRTSTAIAKPESPEGPLRDVQPPEGVLQGTGVSRGRAG